MSFPQVKFDRRIVTELGHFVLPPGCLEFRVWVTLTGTSELHVSVSSAGRGRVGLHILRDKVNGSLAPLVYQEGKTWKAVKAAEVLGGDPSPHIAKTDPAA